MDLQIAGAAAQYGRGMVTDVTAVLMRDFGTNAQNRIDAISRGLDPDKVAAVAPASGFDVAPGTAQPQPLASSPLGAASLPPTPLAAPLVPLLAPVPVLAPVPATPPAAPLVPVLAPVPPPPPPAPLVPGVPEQPMGARDMTMPSAKRCIAGCAF